MTPMTPARIGGIALLVVALGALVMGFVSLSSSESANAASTSSAASTTTSTTSAELTTTTAVSTTTSSALPTTSSPAPTSTSTPATSAAPPAGQGSVDSGQIQAQVQNVPVRVYNNGTIKGLAAKAADDFRKNGWNIVTVGNYSQGVIPTTTVYYRPGTTEENAAKTLAQRFQLRVEPRFAGIANADSGVIVIVTNDYSGAHN